MIDEYDSAYYARNMLCIPCYSRKASETMATCSKCGIRIRSEETRRHRGAMCCNYCASELERDEKKPTCPVCGRKIEQWQKTLSGHDGRQYHEYCSSGMPRGRQAMVCAVCGKKADRFRLYPGKGPVCSGCDSGNPPPSGTLGVPLIRGVVGRIAKFIL